MCYTRGVPPRVLNVFRDPPLDGPTNMARDEALLHDESVRPAALRIYGWDPPTISLGCFQRHALLAELPRELRGLAVVRRCTGGGAILHDREITYCLVADESVAQARQAPVALYRLAHECWRAALSEVALRTELAPDSWPMPSPRAGPFFCFERPGRTDLLLDGRKVLGSAQRRTGGRVLQHGSLIVERRYAAHPGGELGSADPARLEAAVERFVEALAAQLELAPVVRGWTPGLLEDAARRKVAHESDDWIRRR